MTLKDQLKEVKGLDSQAMSKARVRWNQVAKPLYSLGILEDDIVKIAGICGSPDISLGKKALIIMCADNGVVEEGITQTGQEVTAVVTENITEGNSCVCIMAEQAGVNVYPVDIGVAAELAGSGGRYPLVRKKIAYGTKNFCRQEAMTRAEAQKAVETGIELVKELKAEGYCLIATGEMGIGNTTTSSAVASVLLKKPAELMTGRGAGLSDSGLKQKIRVIRAGISMHRPDPADGLDVLSKVGGFDLAGLAGVFLGGAIHRIPIVIDGFISGTAALAAAAICPAAKDYMLASHISKEPAGKLVLDALGLKPVIRGRMCLGEGTGAISFLPLLDMAEAVYAKMSTFRDIEIEEYKPLAQEGGIRPC